MTHRAQSQAPEPRGQVLVLTALMMVVLIGITGLAIDVSLAYLRQREESAIADAAALAGAQDLQIPGSRALPGTAEQALARTHAMDVLVEQLDGASTPADPNCFTSVGCAMPGTPYEVSVQTPSPSCVDCQPRRAIQVAIRQPSFGLSFARIFGMTDWTVSSTSVAGIVQAKQYGVVTLRPPRPRGSGGTDINYDNIVVTGGSVVTVGNADIGTNTSMTIDGDGSAVVLDEGYAVYHYGATMEWTAPPDGVQITSPIDDPAYPVPKADDVPSHPRWATNEDAELDPLLCEPILRSLPPEYVLGGSRIKDMAIEDVTCLQEGVFTEELQGGIGEVVLLTPGVYFFNGGVNMGNASALIGGYASGTEGVALVFRECQPPTLSDNCPFKGNATEVLALNFGGAYQGGSGTEATAAQWNGGYVRTTGTNPVLMSIMVQPDEACLAPPFPTLEPNLSRCSNHNATLQLPGHANLWVAGIQYAPTDNAVITGGSGSAGVLGQIISWTISFTGGSTLNLEAAVGDQAGVLRIDPACSPTVNVCNP